jgi:hypothetical protein
MNTLRDVTVITLAGAGGLWFFGRPVVRALRARSWPKVQGEVAATQIKETTAGMPGSERTVYELTVEYTYPGEGGTHRGSRYSFFGASSTYRSQGAAASARKACAPGSPIEVRVNPADAGESVRSTAIPWLYFVATAFFAMFLVAGASGLVRHFLA